MDLKEHWANRLRGYALAEEYRVRDLRSMSREAWLGQLGRVHGVREPNVNLFLAAMRLQEKLVASGIEFCFIGGLALQRWGEVRQTDDLDLMVWCRLGDEPRIIGELQEIVRARDADVEGLAAVARMYLGTSPDGYGVDASLSWMPYERRVLDRAVNVDYGLDMSLRCCCAEDLAILKTVAGRGQDWVDLKRIVQRSGRTMDWEMVYEELEPLLRMSGREENLDRLRDLVEEHLE